MDPQVFQRELAGAPADFRALISDLPRKALHVRPAPDQWSIRDVLCHLADEERFDFRPGWRLRSVATHGQRTTRAARSRWKSTPGRIPSSR